MRRSLLLALLLIGVTALAGQTSASGATPHAHASAAAGHAKPAKRRCRTVRVRGGHGRAVHARRCVAVGRRPAHRPATQPASSPSSPIADPSGLRAAVRDCANRERAKAGLPALADDAALDRAAQGHAEDMAARHYFSHETPEGRTPWDRIKAALQGESPFMAMGENIAMGFADADATCVGWMNSPGHRANILDRDFDTIGTAWVDGYAVQDFGGR